MRTSRPCHDCKRWMNAELGGLRMLQWLNGSFQSFLNSALHQFIIVEQMLERFIGQIAFVHLAFNEDAHTPGIRVWFVEVKVNAPDVGGFVNVNAYAMSAEKPRCSGNSMPAPQLAEQDVFWRGQVKAALDEFFGPRHLGMPERNSCADGIGAHVILKA